MGQVPVRAPLSRPFPETTNTYLRSIRVRDELQGPPQHRLRWEANHALNEIRL